MVNNGLILQWILYWQSDETTFNAQATANINVTLPIACTKYYGRFPGSRNVHITISTQNPAVTNFDASLKCTKTSGTTSFNSFYCYVLCI